MLASFRLKSNVLFVHCDVHDMQATRQYLFPLCTVKCQVTELLSSFRHLNRSVYSTCTYCLQKSLNLLVAIISCWNATALPNGGKILWYVVNNYT